VKIKTHKSIIGLHLAHWLSAAVVATCLFLGCSPDKYKADSDKRVYDIIDSKWDSTMGPRANYHVNDVTPGPNDIQIAKTIPPSGVLTLPQAVALATAYNRDYHLQKEHLYATALDQRLVQHVFEFQPYGGGQVGYSKTTRNDANNTSSERLFYEANIGFNRLLSTGGLIGMQVATRWTDILSGSGDKGLTSVFSATLNQPLLRGSDPQVVLEPLTQAERNTLYQIRAFNRYRQTFVVQVITQYYQILEQLALARNAQDYYAALESTLGRVDKLVEAGRLPKLEADRVRQDMLATHDLHIELMKNYGQLLDQFKITLGIPTTVEFSLDNGVLDGLEKGAIPYPDFDPNEAVQTALRRRLDIANSADGVVDAQRHVHVAADGLRTGVNFVGSADVDSHGNKSGSAAVALDLPLDRVAEQNIYRKELLILSQRLREYELASDTAALEVRQAYRKLAEAADRDGVLSEAVALAKARLKDTTALLEYARVSSRRVLDAQQALFDAGNAAVHARIDYAVATLEFYRDAGVLQVKPDGMWEVPETQRSAFGGVGKKKP
jgi:outer membrane protein TolC